MRPGDEVIALPSGTATRVVRIEQGGQPVDAAFAPMSVTVHLADDVDLSRGDLLCRPASPPMVSQDLSARLCWMSDRPLAARGRYALKHTTRWTRAIVDELLYRIDVNTGQRDWKATSLGANDLGRVRIRTNMQIYWDQAFIAGSADASPITVTTLQPIASDLHYRGFSRTFRKGGRYGPQWFDYADVSTDNPWRPITGWFTRFGEVLPLLRDSDDMYLVMAPGDEATIHFDATVAPPLPPGLAPGLPAV